MDSYLSQILIVYKRSCLGNIKASFSSKASSSIITGYCFFFFRGVGSYCYRSHCYASCLFLILLLFMAILKVKVIQQRPKCPLLRLKCGSLVTWRIKKGDNRHSYLYLVCIVNWLHERHFDLLGVLYDHEDRFTCFIVSENILQSPLFTLLSAFA